MNISLRSRFIPTFFAILSFFLLIITSVTTSPLSNVAYVIFFLAVLFVFLTSLGYLVTASHQDGYTPTSRHRIVLISLSIVAIIMLRSLQSLSISESLLMISLTLVMFFYLGRRDKG